MSLPERARAQPRDTPDNDPQEKIGPTRLHRPPHPRELQAVLDGVPERLARRSRIERASLAKLGQ